MKIVVIGGVAGGASAAARARRLNEQANIVVLERGQHVSFANCGLPYHIGGDIKEREQLLLQTPESLKASLNLDVRTGHEVFSIERVAKKVRIRERASHREYEEAYDKLVLCPGANPIRPNLPGIDHPAVYVLRNIEDMDLIKGVIDRGMAKNAVVIGAGYIGVEMAENLRMRGLEVDLVEMVDQVMPPLDPEMARELQIHMEGHGVRMHLGTAAAAFQNRAGRVAVELKNTEVVTADLAILSVGVRPETTLAKAAGLELGPRGGIRTDTHMQTSDPDIYAAGDAVEVVDTVTGEPALIPLAGPANRQARVAAENICGRKTVYTSTQGTAIVKVFDMTGGGTGASEKTLKKLNKPYRKVYLHPSGHAGYYPGTAPMHVKLLFEPENGKILGAQVVGFDGVDKRIDVFATALRAGLTVNDLENLELAYAPPFGSAKDPVNMAGFIAANLLKGDVAFWYAEDYPQKTEGGVIVDVRGRSEYEVWHIPGAINIPLHALRKRAGELPKDRPVLLYCRVGFRSYLAYRILKQLGFDKAATLAGGSLTFCSHHKGSLCTGKPDIPFLAYAEEKMAEAKPPPGNATTLDCCGLQCPGPIMKLKTAMEGMAVGNEMTVYASDPGFITDAPAWCRRNGHELLDIRQAGMRIEARIRKGAPAPAAPAPSNTGRPENKTIVVFSGDLDKVLAAFVIANGAAAMGSKVSMFFTFWGLNALRKNQAPALKKDWLSRMFGLMMPRGVGALKLSKLNMLGAGTAMMKYVMRNKRVNDLPALLESARTAGVKLMACTMSMDVMGLQKDELIDGIDFGGVAAFLGEADQSNATLFI